MSRKPDFTIPLLSIYYYTKLWTKLIKNPTFCSKFWAMGDFDGKRRLKGDQFWPKSLLRRLYFSTLIFKLTICIFIFLDDIINEQLLKPKIQFLNLHNWRCNMNPKQIHFKNLIKNYYLIMISLWMQRFWHTFWAKDQRK